MVMADCQFLGTLVENKQRNKDKGLQVIVKCNQKMVDYLDVT